MKNDTQFRIHKYGKLNRFDAALRVSRRAARCTVNYLNETASRMADEYRASKTA